MSLIEAPSNSNSYFDFDRGTGTVSPGAASVRASALAKPMPRIAWDQVTIGAAWSNQPLQIYKMHISGPVGREKTIEEKMAKLSFTGKISFLITNKPSYLVYLGISVSFLLLSLFRAIDMVFSWVVKPAHAAAEVSKPVTASHSLSVFVYIFVSILLSIGCYAAFISKKTKDNTHGWDLIKFLSGSVVGLISPVKIE